MAGGFIMANLILPFIPTVNLCVCLLLPSIQQATEPNTDFEVNDRWMAFVSTSLERSYSGGTS